MTKYIPLFFLYSIPFALLGQSDQLKGRIIADSLEGFAINIVNYTQKLGTTNDDHGYFEIPAQPGDSIIFSSVQYQVVSLRITAKDVNNNNYHIRLMPSINKLDAVNVSNIKLSGNINEDAGAIVIRPFVNNEFLGLPFKDIEQPSVEDRRIYTASSTSLDLLLNVLSGRLKKLKKIKELEHLRKLVHQAENSFNTSFFVKDLHIPKEYIPGFVYYCSEDPYLEDLIKKSKKLGLLEFFQKKAITYNKNRTKKDQ